MPQPRIADVSGVYRAQAGIGQEISDAASDMAAVAAAERRARDVAALTQAKGTFNTRLGEVYNAITTDQSVDPWSYGQLMTDARDRLVDELGKGLGGRLHETWKGQAALASDGLIVKADYEGKKLGRERGVLAYNTLMEQLIRQEVAEPDPQQRELINQSIRETTIQYVNAGYFSQEEGISNLQKLRDQGNIYRVEQAMRLDPSGTVAQLEKGLQANMGIPPDAFPKLLDAARRVERERFEWREQQEAKVQRDTAREQKDTEAVLFGQAQKGQLSRATLDAKLRGREVSPQGYETLVRYLDTKAREDRAEGRAAESLNLQRRAEADRQAEAQVSILADTGALDTRGIIDFARANGLRPTAIDNAVAKASARASSERTKAEAQAEQLISKSFTKGPFEVLEPVTAEAYAAALDEWTFEVYTNKKDPLVAARDIIPRYQASLSQQSDIKLQGLQDRLRYATPDLLEADKLNIPPTMYREQQKLFKQINDELSRQQAPRTDLGRGKKDTRPGPGFWEKWWPGGGQ